MYNLYTYVKRQKDLENENSKNKIDNKEYIKKRDKLAKRFYSRINNFIFEMAKKPIIIKNNYYLSSEKNNFSFQRPKFETDRERIEKFLKTKINNEFNDKLNNSLKKNNLKNKIIIKDIFNENNNNNSEMFSFQLDEYNYRKNYLEIKNNSKKVKEKSIDNYLMEINNNINKIKENKKDKSTISKIKMYISNKNNKEIKDLKHKFNLNKKIILLKKGLKLKKFSKYNLNKTTKHLKKNKSDTKNNDLRIKTYFNSIQQKIICNSKENNDKNNSQKETKNFKGLKSSSSAINFYYPHKIYSLLNNSTNNNLKNSEEIKLNINKGHSNSTKNKIKNKSVPYNNYKEEIIEKIKVLNNPPQFDKLKEMETNNLKVLKQMVIEDNKEFFKNNQEKKMNAGHKGFFSKYDLFSKIKDEIDEEEILEDKNIILYNNHIYYKDDQNDINKLGKIILKKCHFVNNKFFNNKENKLQKGNGKLMITNGLSINEFTDRFSLPK